jgi:hypothetical protein
MGKDCQRYEGYMRRTAFALMLLAGLAACAKPASRAQRSPEIDRVIVTASGKDVIIGAPKGFCVDHSAGSKSQTGTFVLYGDCGFADANGDHGEPTAPIKALLTASVSNDPALGEASDAPGFERFFRSKKGKAALSNSGDASSIEVLQTLVDKDVFYVRARDSSLPIVPNIASDTWRGFLTVSDRLVSVSLLSFQDAPLRPGKGLSQIKAFSQTIQSLNNTPPAPQVTKAAPLQEVDDEAPVSRGKPLKRVGLFRRLFL